MGPVGVAASGARQAVFTVARKSAFGTAAGIVAPLYPTGFLAADACSLLLLLLGSTHGRCTGFQLTVRLMGADKIPPSVTRVSFLRPAR